MAGKLIVFEGGDGIGKSSLSKEVTKRLIDASIPAVSLAFPGNHPGSLGHLVYEIHHSRSSIPLGPITPLALQTLHIAAHLDAIEREILPALRTGAWVILDRFWWSTWVYGVHAGIDQIYLDAIIDAERRRWESVRPDVLFVIDRAEAIRAEHDSTSFDRLRILYRELAAREQANHRVVTVENNDFARSAEMIWSGITVHMNQNMETL